MGVFLLGKKAALSKRSFQVISRNLDWASSEEET